MDTKEITQRIADRLGIAQLNPMQTDMAHTDASEIVLLSPTGSGKTVAFAIRLLRQLAKPDGKVQTVVIAPSRELVIQIADVVRPLAAGWKTVAFYGGHNMADEVKSLSVVPDIVVATPGRLLDHLTRGTLSIADASALVLDEYDKSLELGFYSEMKRIVKHTRRLRLVVLTSATPLAELPDFLSFAHPVTFNFASTASKSRLQTVRVDSPERDKIETLAALLRSLPNGRAIVFTNHRESSERVHSLLKKQGFPVGLYHGGLDQMERQLAIDMLNNGSTPILVSTDLGARGLDIDSVNYVIHYHLPTSPEAWTHRNGRTARMGADGTAFVIIADGEDIPPYVEWDRELSPRAISPDPIRADWATIYFNLGKKEKISKGDVAGFLMQKGELQKDEVGRIIVNDHWAIAAIPAAKAASVVALLAPHRLKGQRVRASLLSKFNE